MIRILRQSTSVDLPIGPFLDSTDGSTAETGLTITQPDIRLKKNGGNWAQKNAAQTLTHEENGNYEVTLDATDTDTLGHLRLHVNEAGALPVWDDFLVVPAAVYDALVSGTGAGLRADIISSAGSAISQLGGLLNANVTQISGDATSADNLESYTDGTTPMPVVLMKMPSALPRSTTLVSPVTMGTPTAAAASRMDNAMRHKSAMAKPSSRMNAVERLSGRAPHMARSFTVPCTASEPMLPPGKKIGLMT